MAKKVHDIFAESIFGVITILTLSIFAFIRANKEKSRLMQITGKITAIEQTNNGYSYPNHDPVKFRYIKIENYKLPFELFIGKDAGDFKPKFEQIDKLHPGDIITVYFNDPSDDDSVNRLAGFIDKGNEPFFIKGSWDKGIALFCAGCGIAILVLVLILKKQGKIA